MERIVCTSGLTSIKRIVDKTNRILDMDIFYINLKKILSFDYSDINGEVLGDIVRNPLIVAQVKFYRGWFWSRVNAYTNGTEYMYLNTRKLARSDASIANTIVHEYIHILDSYNEQYSFGHGSNNRSGKDNSAPYKVGDMFEDLYRSA